VHVQASDIGAVHGDTALVGRYDADDHVEASRFPRAIGTQQADDLATIDLQRDIVDNISTPVALCQITRLELSHWLYLPAGYCRLRSRRVHSPQRRALSALSL